MSNIRIGCAGIVKKDNKILMGIRDKEGNAKGTYITPGGGVDLCEKMEDTFKREIKEEANIEIDNLKQLKTYEIITKPDKHRVIIFWEANYKSGELKGGDDLLDPKFFSKEEVAQLNQEGKISEFIQMVLKDYGWL